MRVSTKTAKSSSTFSLILLSLCNATVCAWTRAFMSKFRTFFCFVPLKKALFFFYLSSSSFFSLISLSLCNTTVCAWTKVFTPKFRTFICFVPLKSFFFVNLLCVLTSEKLPSVGSRCVCMYVCVFGRGGTRKHAN